MSGAAKLAALDAERLAARARLEATFTLLKARSAPGAIAARAMDDARAKASHAGERAIDIARENPIAAGGTAAVILSFLMSTIGRKRRRRSRADEPKTGKKFADAPHPGASATHRHDIKGA